MSEIQNQIYLHAKDQVPEPDHTAPDRTAMEEFNIPGFTLMQRAAEAACSQLRQTWTKASYSIVLAGVGSNGGDDYVIAHKGNFSHVLYTNEKAGMAGSPILAVEATARTSRSLVAVAMSSQHGTVAISQ